MESTNESLETALTARLAALEKRLVTMEHLRRSETVRRIGVGVAALVLGISGATSLRSAAEPAPQKGPQVLVCKEVQVVGDDGKIRADLLTNNLGAGTLMLYGANGNLRVRLTTDTINDGADLEMFHADGTLHTRIAAFSDNKQGYIQFADIAGKQVKILP